MMNTNYRLESALVTDFVSFLFKSNYWRLEGIAQEFNYSAGRTDVIGRTPDGELLAFEAKLSAWRKALHQAYRNKCFAHRSYVVLPQATAMRALQFESEFKRRRVGIIAVDENGFSSLLDSEGEQPCLQWLTQKAEKNIDASENRNDDSARNSKETMQCSEC